jgi:hypothetical protein
MSRIIAAMMCAVALLPAAVRAQEVYGPSVEFEGEEDTPNPLEEIQQCETQPQEDGVILVCRELTDSERYRSPIPREVQSDRVIIPGLTDPPCWVVPRGGVCIRFGYAPEPAIMVDVTAFPEPLDEADAALVSEIEADPESAARITGARVAIDLSEDED